MRFPLTISKRTTLNKLYNDLEQERQKRMSAERAAAKSGRKVTEVLTETGRLAEELRLLRVHIDRNYNRQSVRFEFEIADRMLIEGYRYGLRGQLFREAVAHHIERAFYMNPETRELLR